MNFGGLFDILDGITLPAPATGTGSAAPQSDESAAADDSTPALGTDSVAPQS
ncbi:MAG: hypothetical protein H0X50_08440, partial [Nitrosopumilus sp.]|nr:hypothetical protein [Nitrosopumilus sp.]